MILGLYDVERYSMIALVSLAQWNNRRLSAHTVLGSNPISCGPWCANPGKIYFSICIYENIYKYMWY